VRIALDATPLTLATGGLRRYLVELVEADKTELVNFIPPDIIERLSKPKPA
jgi:hypothetical protein